jgi:hypothetical protein
LAQERRLGEELDVRERRARLQRDGRKRFTTMEPARRMNIRHGNSENQLRNAILDPAPNPPEAGFRTITDDVVGLVDRLQERIQMRAGPAFRRGGHEHNGKRAVTQTFLDRSSPTDRLVHHDVVREAVSCAQQRDELLADLIGPSEVTAREHNHVDTRPGEGRAMEVSLIGIVQV